MEAGEAFGGRASRAPHAALIGVLAVVVVLLAVQPPPSPDPAGSTPGTGPPPVFVENAGQTDAAVRYMARGPGHTFYFAPDRAVLDFRRGKRGVALELRFRGASAHPRIVGERRGPGRVNYIAGSARHTGLAVYEQLRYRDLWPGIDMVFREQGGRLKYEFLVRAGANPADIRLTYAGADSTRLTGAGTLAVATPLGVLRDAAPRTAQGSKAIDSRYVLSGSTYGFALGAYDASRAVVIDPGLLFSTFLGGVDSEYATDLDADAAGNLYLTGQTRSASFPATPGAYDVAVDGVYDAFVTKFDGGGHVVYSTYLGGSQDDSASDISVDAGGAAYVGGSTTSADFPTTPGAYDETLTGTGESFVTKLNQAGTALVYSTFLAGNLGGLAENDAGDVYVTGTAFGGFPVSAGAPDTTAVAGEAFLTRLDSSGGSLEWATYIGGRGEENAFEVEVDGSGEPYVMGRTTSIEEFPFTPGAFDTQNEGENVFVTKVDSGGTAFDYSTLLGTNGIVNPGMDVDAAGHAYIVGSGNVPTTPGAFDTSVDYRCAFATKMNLTGTGLVYSTKLGGMCNVTEVAVDSAGNAYLAQDSQGGGPLVTTPGAFDQVRNGIDVYVFKLNANGTAQLYGSFLGGSDNEFPSALAAVGSGTVAIAGVTSSTDFPTSPDAEDSSYNGNDDAFLTKLQTYDGYPRPKGATPLHISLVVAYKPRSCPSSQELIHGPPLAYSSCPPQKESQYATVGTGDSNGLPARNEGYMRFVTQVGNPATPADEADLRFDFFSDDVFNVDLTDYTSQLRLLFTVRMTDRNSADSAMATTQDYLFPLFANCVPNADALEGSACALSSSVEAIIPGAITEGKRSIWGIDNLRVFDAGSDGDAHTLGDNTIFARPGIFIP